MYDLEDQTLIFSKNAITLANKLLRNLQNRIYKSQVIRSATSICANYREACATLTKKDFIHKLSLSNKEAKEIQYWLELISTANPLLKDYADIQIKDAF